MKVTTASERVQRHRRMLLSMYLADHELDDDGLPKQRGTGNRLREQALTYGTEASLPPMHAPRAGREDRNPYVHFDPEACILCNQCVRYCDEVEAVSAITLAGAMTEKQAIGLDIARETEVRTTCTFCGVGCQVDLHVREDKVVRVTSPPPGETLNDGNLCIKGRFSYEFIHHDDRLTTPLVRGEDGEMHPASWDDAIRLAAEGLLGVKQRHGADALGFVSSSRCTGEENYLLQKMARAVFGTNNCHQCAAT
jgi:predicted molibdopterin-dependent oxidoreductase YjgC